MNSYILLTVAAYLMISMLSVDKASALNCYTGIGKNITDKNPAFCNSAKNEVCYATSLRLDKEHTIAKGCISVDQCYSVAFCCTTDFCNDQTTIPNWFSILWDRYFAY